MNYTLSKIKTPSNILEQTATLLADFRKRSAPSRLKLRPTATKWKPPALAEYKTNYDDAIFDDLNEAGIGLVVRNYKGGHSSHV